MTTLAEHMIVAGANNHPPMLEKSMYDSWQIRMLLYIQGKEHGIMIHDLVLNGPLDWGTIEANGVMRTKTYEELSEKEKLQADCDLKATNIVLQGLPPDVYSLVNHHNMAKENWDRVRLLMKGTELTQQERECKLYNEFDRFTSIKGETLYEYYLRFAQLINDMHIIKMTMQQVQVNTKFLNSLQPEWRKFVTDVKLAKDLHTIAYDKIYTYLSQHEAHVNEIRMMRERYPDPLALLSPLGQQMYSPSLQSRPYEAPHHLQQYQNTYQTQLSHTTPSVPQNAYHAPLISQQPQAEFPQLDSSLVVLSFLPGDDPISCLNKAMAFMSTTEEYVMKTEEFVLKAEEYVLKAEEYVLRNINQATIQDGRVTVQQVRRRQGQSFTGTGTKGNATSSRKCTQLKRPRNSAWFKKKMLLVQAYESGQTDDLDAYDSNYDDISSTKAVLMANLSSYDSDDLFEYLQDMQNAIVQDTKSSAQQDAMIMSVFEQRSTQVTKCIKGTKETQIVNETLTAELERYKERVLKKQTKEKEDKYIEEAVDLEKEKKELENIVFKVKAHQIKPMLYDGIVISKKHDVVSVDDFRETLILAEDKQAFWLPLSNHISEQLVVPHTSVKIEVPKKLPKENDHLFELFLSQDIVYICVNSLATRTNCHEIEQSFIDEYNETLELKAQLAKKEHMVENTVFNELVIVYVTTTCPSLTKSKEKLVAVTPLNKNKKVRFAEPATSLSNTKKQVDSYNTQDSNPPLLTSIGMKSSTSTSRLQPSGNTKKIRISRTTSNNHKNKVEDYPRSVKSSSNKKNRVIKPVYNANVKHSMLNANSELNCVTCNECMFDAIHDLCVLDFINDLNVRSKSKSAKSSKKKTTWKPTGKIFTSVGYRWLPTGRTFTIDGTKCPLTRIASTRVVHLKETSGPNRHMVHGLWFTWVKFLRSKDEAPEFIIKFLKMIQIHLNTTVRNIRTDNRTEFVNQTQRSYYEDVGISHETSVARTLQQNGVVKRRNQMLVEATRTMLIFSKALLFLWVEAVATTCYTQNRSLIRLRHGKTPYELLHDRKPDLTYFHVFGALCYPTNDIEDLGKLKPKADIGIFIGYTPAKKAYRIYNRRTQRIMETIHLDFDELTAITSK
ncbi:retrovirus-related pol polyprotein from transposon TNT 1-94 [Tanacetum coccineum]